MSSTSSLLSNTSSLQLGATSATLQQQTVTATMTTATLLQKQMDVSLTPSTTSSNHLTNLTPTLSRQPGSDDDDSGCALEDYAWVPPDLKPDQIRQYFECIPEEKRPYVNSVGETYRNKQMLYQLPPHDNDAAHCFEMTREEKEALRQFTVQRKRDSLGRGKAVQIPLTNSEQISCLACNKSVENGSIGIYVHRAQGYCHPGCFTCSTCQELLVDLVYFFNATDGRLYCGRHQAELFKPRCPACDEIIFSEECTEAEGKSWHMHHFVCHECNELLGGKRYFMKQDIPYCCKCYDSSHTEYCATCGQLIERDQPQISFEDQHWHSNDKCFKCNTCYKSLINGTSFIPQQGLIYCSNECARFSKPPANPPPSSGVHTKGFLKPTGQSPPQLLPSQNLPPSRHEIKMDHNLLNSPGLSDQDASQILQLQRQIHNQSRSRKPFNFAMSEYDTEIGRMDPGSPPVNLPAVVTQQVQQQLDQPACMINRKLQMLRQQQQQQLQDSFDDLESGAVINMNQFNVVKSNIVHAGNKSPLVQTKAPLKSNLKKNPANSAQMPVSILKRFDSSERMHPFSRPNGLASASASMLQPHSQAAAQLCSASVNGGFDMSSLSRSRGNYGDSVDYGYGMKLSKSFHSQPGSPVMHQQIQPQVRKRVQFANIPPLNSSAGDLHLTGGFEPSSSKSSRHHNRPSSHHSHHHHGHHQKHHKHHGKRSHRRSSSTGNFNNMSMQAMPPSIPYNHHHHHSHHNKRQNVRQLSNRSLNMPNPQIYSDSDYCCTGASGYGGYPSHGVDYGDYDDYEDNDYFNNTCSTCSSSTLTSSSNTTTSTDSDSEESDLEDDFGMMSLNAMPPAMHQQRQRQLQFDQRSLQHQQQLMMHMQPPRRPMQPTANSQGLKISYVDSLPLARTNPAPKAIKSKENKKKSGGLGGKLKKKDNCVVS